jgi:hypothetical protein
MANESTKALLSGKRQHQAEGALRLQHDTTVEHAGTVQTSSVDEHGANIGASAAQERVVLPLEQLPSVPVEAPTDPGSPVAEPEADDHNSPVVRYIREKFPAALVSRRQTLQYNLISYLDILKR